eukprot:SAG22_NODE_697_length_7825_cov_8.757831_6_plen_74_part_00
MTAAVPPPPSRSQVLKHTIKTEGVMSLYRGWAITVARAGPMNGVLFLFYEMTIRALAGRPVLPGLEAAGSPGS